MWRSVKYRVMMSVEERGGRGMVNEGSERWRMLITAGTTCSLVCSTDTKYEPMMIMFEIACDPDQVGHIVL